jgi:DNA primase catalytic core
MIAQTSIEKIKQAVKIEEVVNDFVALKKRGINYIGLCPFHNEKTPSFTVSPAKGIYKCFGCGESGDAITFVMNHEGMSYPEVLRWLAKKYGIPIEESISKAEREKRSKKESLKIATAFAQKVFRNKFKDSPGYAYMKDIRKFSDKTLDNFGIGFAADNWTKLSDSALKKGYAKEYLISAGLSGKRKTDGGLYDRFRNRVMFPYFDLAGNIIGFTSRILKEDKKQAKYINSPNSELFNKSNILYGVFQAKRSITENDCAYLVEGNTDVMSFHQLTIENTIGTSGTALSDDQVKLIRRFTTHVIFIFDADNAGAEAALKSIDKFIANGFRVEIVSLPKGNDPDSFARHNTKAEVLKYINKNKLGFFDYQTQKLLEGKQDPKEISEAAKQIGHTISYIEDNQERKIYQKQLSEKYNLDERLLEDEINKLTDNKEKQSSTLFAFDEAKSSVKTSDAAVLKLDSEKVIKAHFEGKKNTIGYDPETVSFDSFKQLREYTHNLTFDDDYEAAQFINGDEKRLLIIMKHLVVLGFNIEIGYHNEIDDERAYNSFINYYIELLARHAVASNDKSVKSAIEKAAEIISFLGETERMLKTDFAVQKFKWFGHKLSVADFKKILKSYLKKNERESKKEITISASNPHGLSKEQLESKEKYGFFEKDNQLYFETKDGGDVCYSNYVIKPLFHIRSTNETRKLFLLKNNKNQSTIIEVDMESMVNPNKWMMFTEEKGNYLFWGTKHHFVKLKLKLYDDTIFCDDIENLGWQPQGFWAWADGVLHKNQFIPVDNYGIVKLRKDENYYIPAFSQLYKGDRSVFKTERKFIRKQQDISFKEWSQKFKGVYGDNAKLSIAGLLTTVFSDFIFKIVGSLPLLNFFGVKGTGKTEHAKSLLHFFGEEQNILNIHKGTEYAAAVHLENFRNAFAIIDEYKNSLDIRKIEYLKSIYNRDGRLRGSIKAGVKTETTQVNSMVLLCGQEMPTADVALFSRLVFMPYYNPEFSQAQKDRFNELKAVEKQGLTHLTEELLKYRDIIEKHYEKAFYLVEKELSDKLPSSIDGRLIRNYATLLTTFKTLENYIDLAFSYDDLFSISLARIKEQYNIMSSSNEVSSFWDSFVSLSERGIVSQPNNFRLEEEFFLDLKVKMQGGTEEKTFDFSGHENGCEKILYLKMNTVYDYYAELAAKTRQEIMPKRSLEYYLEHSKAFLGKREKMRFGSSNTTGWAFLYSYLNIELKEENESGEPVETEDEKLPF